MNKPKASDMVEFSQKDIYDFNFEVVKSTCDMNWKYEWQRKIMIYRIFLHMADMVWKTYKDYKKHYGKGI